MASTTVEGIDTPTVRARAQHLHVAPNKVRQVLALVRGLSAEDASRVLQLCQKDAAEDVLKVLESAIANAEHNNQLPLDELYVARAFADEGPTRKWGQARARGRYFRVRHRSTHLTIILARYDEDELEQRRRREEAQAASTGRGRGSQRRRAERVRRSRAAQRGEAHDHDHDHDHEAAEELSAAEVGPATAEDIEPTLERDEDIEAAGEADAEADAGAEASDDTETAAGDDEEESK
jgi:large subunit ribosomal protein L22